MFGAARRHRFRPFVLESVYRNAEKTAFRIASSMTVEVIGKCCPSVQTRKPPERNAYHKRLGWYDDTREFGFRCPAGLAGREKPAFDLSWQPVQSFNQFFCIARSCVHCTLAETSYSLSPIH